MKILFCFIALAMTAGSMALGQDKLAPPELVRLGTIFFGQLKEGKVADAYAGLLLGSKIGEKMEKVVELQDKTNQALKEYGAITGSELVKTEFVGEHLCRLVYLTRTETIPIRWQITYYRPVSQWRVFNMQIDDGVMDFFSKK